MCTDCNESLGIPTGATGATGPQGIQGIPGDNGVSIVWKGSFATAPVSPVLNWGYYDTVQKKSFIYNGTTWQMIAMDGATGPAGATGSAGATGAASTVIVTSTTSNSLAIASKTFTYTSTPTLGWLTGTRLRAYNSVGNFMEGVVTAVSSTSVTILMDYLEGSGTYASWNITIAGVRGSIGLTGATGSTGPQGPIGPASFIYETTDGNLTPAEADKANQLLRRKIDDTGYEFVNFSQLLADIQFNTNNLGFNQF